MPASAPVTALPRHDLPTWIDGREERGTSQFQVHYPYTGEVIGSAPHRLVATAPSIVAPRETFAVHVRAEDEWGNPASDADLEISIQGDGAARCRILPGCYVEHSQNSQ
jgi:hypothetical protein